MKTFLKRRYSGIEYTVWGGESWESFWKVVLLVTVTDDWKSVIVTIRVNWRVLCQIFSFCFQGWVITADKRCYSLNVRNMIISEKGTSQFHKPDLDWQTVFHLNLVITVYFCLDCRSRHKNSTFQDHSV